jgi:RHS repeat-associated protein
VLETNPLGQATRFVYNDSHLKIEEELVGSGKSTFYSYNDSGWMVSKTEKHTNGEIFVTTYDHDALGNLIQETDPYGTVTTFSRDRMGRIIEKKVSSDDATDQRVFNVLGQVIQETDPNGNATHYTYNIYGMETNITYPDGSEERFRYYNNGWLKQHWKVDGTSVRYNYNPAGKVLEEKTLDTDGKLLKTESFTYKGNHLIQKIDAMGLTTSYSYDHAGRKIQETIGSKVTTYDYDDLDRVIKINDPLGASEAYTYDALDRVASKTLIDSEGKIYAKEAYAYDIHGNKTESKFLENEGVWTTHSSQYDSKGKILWQEDPLGNRTTWEHDHNFINEKGQKVLASTIKDPLGRVAQEINDTYGRLARKDLFDQGALVSRTEYTYDLCGREIEKRAYVYANDQKIREYWVVSTYDKLGNLTSETEMPDGKTTQSTYNALNKLICKIKPDGVAINYDYDSLGRICALYSKDIHYTYIYDLHNNPIEAHDHINNCVQRKSYDLHGNLLHEEIYPGVIINYCYDEKDRITKVILPDNSSIVYVYDPFHLVKVERYNSEGTFTYRCTCPSYNLKGNRIKDISPAGTVDYSYNEIGRKVKIDSNNWSASLDAFDPAGNLLSSSQNDPAGSLKNNYEYDRFDHLTNEGTNNYSYDSLGNCLKKNDQPYEISQLNQLKDDKISQYIYDQNGNLISQTNPEVTYDYDSLNRLKRTGETYLSYDAFGRCMTVGDQSKKKVLLYQGKQEIGSWLNGKLHELRIVHPKASQETTFAIEIDQKPYFPIQDDRYNIVALRQQDGSIAQFSRFSPFGQEILLGDTSIKNPWRFANRRQIQGLSLFEKRFYNPSIMRWQTPDPLGFEDGLNLYTFVHNNPLRYYDPDGQFAWVFAAPIVIPLFEVTFGVGVLTVSTPTLIFIGKAVCVGVGVAAISYAVNRIDKEYEHRCLQEKLDEEDRKKDEEMGFAPDRPLPQTQHGVHIPDADDAHTQLGIGEGRNGRYRQAREFDKNGKPVRDIDFTDHGRAHNHTNPHQHCWLENSTGGSKERDDAEPVTDWIY